MMIIAKLLVFASPVIVASVLFLANPAAAISVDSTSTKMDIDSTSTIHGLATFNQADKSNPIIDHLSCKCAYCAGAQSPLQGKLPTSNIL